MSGSIRVEVAYASPRRQALRTVTLPEGSRVADAIAASGLAHDFPEIDLAIDVLGIYGRRVRPDTVLRDRDRVEVLRPLKADPKEARRARAGRRATR
jgi:uncharacterized protein